jgi:hypothetical protein
MEQTVLTLYLQPLPRLVAAVEAALITPLFHLQVAEAQTLVALEAV